jgi:hypothetical protein
VCQSVLLKIQEKHLHDKKINGFINKLPPLQTMESLLFQSLRIGFFCFPRQPKAFLPKMSVAKIIQAIIERMVL